MEVKVNQKIRAVFGKSKGGFSIASGASPELACP